MAWIAKPSNQPRQPTRDGPCLTDEMKRTLRDTYLPRYERPAGALLPALHMVQHEYGWIPDQAMHEIAEFLSLAPAEVLDTASFYEEYWLRPRGKHVVAICRSIACEFCGQPAVSNAAKAHLGIDVGETTDDGEFTLIELECLGSCGTAPALLVDETLHENISPDQVQGIIERARAAKPH